MQKLADFVIKNRYTFTGIYVVLILVCALMIPFVNTNYDMTKYLDENAPSVVSLHKMEEEFGSVGTAQLMVENVSEEQAQEIMQTVMSVPGVSAVVFDADDPASYKDNAALYKIFLETGNYEVETDAVIEDIRAALQEYTIAMNGGAVQSQYLRTGVSGDMIIILIVALAIVFGILLLTSNSWADVLIFAIVVAGSLIINLGTNLFLGEVSFVTQSICAVMQLALAMDYSIILLHRFDEERQKGLKARQAICTALAKTFAPVSASSLTTIAGLVALMFMQFTIGFDIGMVLAKGVIISLLCVFFFMPAFVLLFSRLIEKSKHKSVYAAIKERSARKRAERTAQYERARADKGGKPQKKIRTLADFQFSSRFVVSLVLIALIVAGCAIQTNLQYSYVIDTSKYADADINVEDAHITETFGTQNPLVVIVPQGDPQKEILLTEQISAYAQDGKTVVNAAQGAASMGLYTDISPLVSQSGDYAVEILFEPGNMLSALVKPMINDLTASLFTKYSTWMTEDGYVRLSEDALTPFDALAYTAQYDFFHTHAQDLQEILQNNSSPLTLALGFFENTMSLGYTAAEFAETHADYNITDEQAAALWNAMGKSADEEVVYADIAAYGAASGAFAGNAHYATVAQVQTLLFSQLKENPDFMQNIVAALGQKETQDNLQNQVQALYGQVAMFNNGEYSRLVFNLDLPISSAEAFTAVQDIQKIIDEIYSESYMICESYNYLDIKTTFENDTVVVNLISFFAIFVIILLTFRSLSVPVLLTVLIQGAIWVSSSVNVLMNAPLFFIAFIVVMCIQMGATIDYAILMTDRYLAARQIMGRKQSIAAAFDASIVTILTSGSILVLAAFVVGLISRVAIISTMGYLLSRGCLISVLFVLLALPQLLLLFDPVIRKTTLGGKNLYDPRKKKKSAAQSATNTRASTEQKKM